MRYRLTEIAKQDIREITRHIRNAQRSPQNARLVAMRLKSLFRKLVEIPQLGHARAELHDDAARVVFVTGVLVIYDATTKPLTILPVVHGSRDLNQIRHRR